LRKNRSNKLVGFLLIFFLITFLAASDNKKFDTEQQVKNIDRVLKESYLSAEPGAAVLVVERSKVIFKGGYGMANMELGVKIGPQMVFRIGSITKQFTATAIMMLVDEGKISLSDPLNKFFPKYPINGDVVTIEHLLHHTSGIKSYTSMAKWRPLMKTDLTVQKMIDIFKNEPVDFKPGERFLYNNSGYFLLGAIIEKVSGKTYQKFIRQRIFDPLGMKNSFYGSHSRIILNRASGYQKKGNGFINADYLSMTQPYSAGSLLSTVDDLYRWSRSLFSGTFISAKSLKAMLTPGSLNGGEFTGYGFGFSISKIKGNSLVSHGGGINGFITYAMYLPEKEIFIAALTNCVGHKIRPTFVAQRIALILLGDPYRPKKAIKLPSHKLDQVVGTYKISETKSRKVIREGDKLFTKRSGGRKMRVFAASETEFFYENSFSYFTIVMNKKGQVVKMVMHTLQGDDEAVKINK